MTEVRVEELPLGDPRLRHSLEVPWRLYKGDPFWTPPLRPEYLGNRLFGTVGLLPPLHPYQQHAEVTHFLARKGPDLVDRVSAAINRRFNEHHGTEIGFFGFFETVNDFEVARGLLDSARDWVAQRGMKVLRGQGEYSNATQPVMRTYGVRRRICTINLRDSPGTDSTRVVFASDRHDNLEI